MKIKELPNGQYIQVQLTTETIVARIVKHNVVYLNTTVGLHYCHSLEFWEKLDDVTPIDFQTTVALLVKDCMEHNQDVPDVTQDTVDAKSLKPGSYFTRTKNGTVGLVFNEEDSVYLTKGMTSFWDYTKHIGPVTPLSFHQATLQLAQQQINPPNPFITRLPLPKPAQINNDLVPDYVKEIGREFEDFMNKFMLVPPIILEELNKFMLIPPIILESTATGNPKVYVSKVYPNL